mmetsp:Transcript_1131/g.1814  ORF Transcript_1131/g.1814 Transcript_1131/m.1814 type:complete len:84 (-) Transcript_1131:62-313(-)
MHTWNPTVKRSRTVHGNNARSPSSNPRLTYEDRVSKAMQLGHSSGRPGSGLLKYRREQSWGGPIAMKIGSNGGVSSVIKPDTR